MMEKSENENRLPVPLNYVSSFTRNPGKEERMKLQGMIGDGAVRRRVC